MIEKYPRTIKEKETKDIVDFLTQNALGNIIIRDSAPTLDEIKPNTIVKVGTTIYIKFSDGSGISISGTALT